MCLYVLTLPCTKFRSILLATVGRLPWHRPFDHHEVMRFHDMWPAALLSSFVQW